VYDVVDGQFTELASIGSFDSLGNFYSYITELCGFKAGRHEGKITGMAAYGKPIYIPQLRQLMIECLGNFKNVGNIFFRSALKELQRILPADFSHKDLAASIQVYSEELVVGLVKYWLQRTQRHNVALAGGVVANVKINQRIHEIDGVRSTYIHPGMSDEGLPVGAALALYHSRFHDGPYNPNVSYLDHVYLGPDYTNEEIRLELGKYGVEAHFYEEVEREIARILAEGGVVARFNGRMEYGPRALGNRSILYQAGDPSVNHWLNTALKRTEFMPFAPIIMAEHAHQCFEGLDGAQDTARFMTITFNCTPWMAKTNPGVVHVDNTARPQLVSERDNLSMYRILDEFNMHEEPIVCSPSDAIRAFKLGQLDYLAIGKWIARNPHPIKRSVNTEKFDTYLNRRGAIMRRY
jgi:carbamoyltransferase